MGTLAAGIKDIFSTAKTTGTNVMLSDNDGTPDGHISMANLASILGALPLIQSTGVTKFEDIKQGIYQPSGGKIGSVDVPIYYGMVICFRTDNSTDFSQNDGNMLLLAFGYQGDIHYWYRWHAYGTDVWRQITTQAET